MRKWTSHKIIICLLFLINLSAFAVVPLTMINNWHINKQPHHWQLTLDTSHAVNYHAFSLNNPARIVIDLKNVSLRTHFSKSQLKGTPILRIRTAYHAGKTLRMVLDLRQALTYQISNIMVGLIPHHQLIIAITDYAQPVAESKKSAKKPSFNTETSENDSKSTRVQPIFAVKPLRRVRDVVVMIDPGHGGKDPGATGRGGTHEKNVVLAISKYLAVMLNKTPGYRAYLTRTGDYYLTLRQRLAIARKYKPDMFVAIHADAYRNRKAQGASVFALSQRGATSEAARWIAEKENKSELMGGVDLSDKSHLLKSVLLDLSQTVTIRSSLKMGTDIISKLDKVARLHHDKVDQAAFVVLKSPDIPSLLIETGFLSNPSEERRLKSRYYQKKIARAIDQGITRYFYHSPPRGTWLALKKFQPNGFKAEYIVKRGDTISEIASRFGISIQQLRRTNKLSSDVIRIGQRLLIIQPQSVRRI